MGEEMKVEIVSRETIKPSSPTPPDLKTYKLSLFDQLVPNAYISILLFYPPIFDKDHDRSYHEKIDIISKRLKSSLSKTLTRFYHFAGKINDGASIECNDEGAIFIKARVHGVMASILEEYSDNSIGERLQLGGSNMGVEIKDHLLQVQVNFFDCGGLVIGMTMSHKLGDASTMSTFLKAWSAIANSNSDDHDIDFADFSMASILPASNAPRPSSSLQHTPNVDHSREVKLAVKRYVFDGTKINLLKEQAINEGVKNPTRVECVSSLLWKCLMTASRSRFAVKRPSMLIQAVNLRTRTIPPLPPNSIGNMVEGAIGSIDESTEIGLQSLIRNLRRGLRDTSKRAENGYKAEEIVPFLCKRIKEFGVLSQRDGIDFYVCSSWCRFPFYETDLGWGKPIWVCPGRIRLKNFFILLDARDGDGIEAWCTLLEEDIALLEQDQEFLTFAARDVRNHI